MLADSELVLAEAERVRKQGANPIDVAALESKLTDFENRRGHLLKLYEIGEINDDYFLRESTTIRGEKAKVEEQMQGCRRLTDCRTSPPYCRHAKGLKTGC